MNSTLRLTRRGRLVILSALVALLCVAFLAGRSGAQAATEGAPKPYASTTVQPGETLWSLAKRVAPGHDPRATVEQIQRLNHLTTGTVRAGQQLLLPHAA
jgi:LysM repeat protein